MADAGVDRNRIATRDCGGSIVVGGDEVNAAGGLSIQSMNWRMARPFEERSCGTIIFDVVGAPCAPERQTLFDTM